MDWRLLKEGLRLARLVLVLTVLSGRADMVEGWESVPFLGYWGLRRPLTSRRFKLFLGFKKYCLQLSVRRHSLATHSNF